ncbi:MAG: 4-oxalocrotonate tautomerase [Candidatus Azotimanducaceae bacterium]|jgi:4-oxalocrotonate tautomerase
MPYIHLQITKGATREERSKIIREMTDTPVNTFNKKPEHIHIVI